MKKFVVLAVMSLSAVSAYAGRNVVCVDRDAQDSAFSANFELGASSSTVELFVPNGETSGEKLTGECRADEGALELSMTCDIMTSSDSGYEVHLFSIGGPALFATVTPWVMGGEKQIFTLTCGK